MTEEDILEGCGLLSVFFAAEGDATVARLDVDFNFIIEHYGRRIPQIGGMSRRTR